MNLRQLQFISEVARRGLNVSAAAENLYTSQPGVSKQIRQLEDELGVQIFERRGKQLTRVTDAGRAIIEYANRALIEVEAIGAAAQEYRDPTRGSLAIATTQTQARYRLPSVIERFRERYPRIVLHIYQGTPEQIAELTVSGVVDFAIATEGLEHFEDLLMMPCYHWNRAIVVPAGHPLCELPALTLAEVARHPLLTYVFGFSPRSALDVAFRAEGLQPQVVFTATDADVIKTYVRLGLGVGILAAMAFEASDRPALVALDARELFSASTTNLGFRRGAFLRDYMYEFMRLFAPHLTRELVETAAHTRSKGALRSLFMDRTLPTL